MKKDKRNKNKDDGWAIDDVEEVGIPPPRKAARKRNSPSGWRQAYVPWPSEPASAYS